MNQQVPGSGVTSALRSALRPRSVAVVGASANEDRLGSSLVRSITQCGFAGEVYAVGSGGTCYGLEILPSLSAIGAPVDLVLVAVRASACPDVIAEAGRIGAGSAMILANGFAEAGNTELSEELLARATEGGVTVLGPNTMGIFSTPASFNAAEDVSITKGRVAVVSQSGSVGIDVYEALKRLELGMAYFVSLGNQLMVSAADVLDYLYEDDDEFDSVLVYLEGLAEPAKFLEAAGRLSGPKPVAVLRGGVTGAGARAAASHTGAMATDNAVISAGLRAAGVLEVSSPHELCLVAQAFGAKTLARGRRIGLVSDSGGYASLGADAAERAGLTLDPFPAETKAALREIVLPQAAVGNPIDLVDFGIENADLVERAVEICIDSGEIDAVMYTGTYGGYELMAGPEMVPHEIQSAKSLVGIRDATGKPLVMHSLYPRAESEGTSYLRSHGVPVVETLDDAAAILAYQVDWDARHAQARTRWLPAELAAGGSGARTLREDAGRKWFGERVDIGLPPSLVVRSEDEAVAAQAELGDGRLVMKVLSDDVSHKSDVGGVVVGIETAEDLRQAWQRMAGICQASGTEPAALVTPFVDPGVEVLIGAIRDSPLGPLVMVGTGGIYAEDIADRTMLFPPFDRDQVEAAVGGLAVLGKVLNSRRAAPVMKEQLIELTTKVGDLLAGSEELLELDLNPVVLGSSGAAILDVRVSLDEKAIGGNA